MTTFVNFGNVMSVIVNVITTHFEKEKKKYKNDLEEKKRVEKLSKLVYTCIAGYDNSRCLFEKWRLTRINVNKPCVYIRQPNLDTCKYISVLMVPVIEGVFRVRHTFVSKNFIIKVKVDMNYTTTTFNMAEFSICDNLDDETTDIIYDQSMEMYDIDMEKTMSIVDSVKGYFVDFDDTCKIALSIMSAVNTGASHTVIFTNEFVAVSMNYEENNHYSAEVYYPKENKYVVAEIFPSGNVAAYEFNPIHIIPVKKK